jgi:hypothetical protein
MIESYKKTTLRNYPNMGKWSESGSRNGVQPSISGAIFENGYCFIPISSGKCMFYKDRYTELYSPNTNGWLECDDQPTMTDPTTGKKYYRFSSLDEFILN